MMTNEARWYGNRALRWESEDLASIAGSGLHDPSDSRQISSLSQFSNWQNERVSLEDT